jgi:hypothetical protein
MDYFTWQQKDAGKTEYETFQAKNGQIQIRAEEPTFF